jgi:hypothetical protein
MTFSDWCLLLLFYIDFLYVGTGWQSAGYQAVGPTESGQESHSHNILISFGFSSPSKYLITPPLPSIWSCHMVIFTASLWVSAEDIKGMKVWLRAAPFLAYTMMRPIYVSYMIVRHSQLTGWVPSSNWPPKE